MKKFKLFNSEWSPFNHDFDTRVPTSRLIRSIRPIILISFAIVGGFYDIQRQSKEKLLFAHKYYFKILDIEKIQINK